MTQATHELIRQFFRNLGNGTPDEGMFAPDWVVWTLSTKTDQPGQNYVKATKVLASLYPAGLTYTVQSIIIDGERAAARVVGEGTLHNGVHYLNDYAYLFEIKDGRIARLEEFFDTKPVAEKILPLLMEAMGGKLG